MYLVIENTPGYMPDSDPAEFGEYADAVAYANELADELEAQGFVCDRSVASRDNYFAISCVETEGTARLGRSIEVIHDDDTDTGTGTEHTNPATDALRRAVERGVEQSGAIVEHDSQCGTCGRTWSSVETPTPSARCPFETEHVDEHADEQGYNGWKNYETWAVGMYLDGNYTGESTYREVLELVREVNVPDTAVIDVADALQAWFDDELYNDENPLSGIVADLLRSAIDEIDWRELATHKIAEVIE